MTPVLIASIVAAVAALAAISLFLHARGVSAARDDALTEVEQLRDALRQSEKRLEDKTREQRRKGEDLAELRRKLEKARKRAASASGDQRGESQRVRELEEALRLAQADRKAAVAELDRLQAAPVRPAAPAAQATPAVQAAPAAQTAPAAQAVEPSADQLEALKVLVERAERAEERVASLDSELQKASVEAARYAKKSKSLLSAYDAQRGELDAKKDRLRQQQAEIERLQALRAGFEAARQPAAAGTAAVPAAPPASVPAPTPSAPPAPPAPPAAEPEASPAQAEAGGEENAEPPQ